MTQFSGYLTHGGRRGLLRRHHQPRVRPCGIWPCWASWPGIRSQAARRLRRRRWTRHPRPSALPPTPPAARTPAGPPARQTEAITFAGPGADSAGRLGRGGGGARLGAGHAREPRVHRPHPRRHRAARRDGYSALAPDLLSGEGGTAAFADPAQATAALLGGIGQPVRRRLRPALASSCVAPRPPMAAVRVLLRRRHGVEAAEPRRPAAAAAPFYGPLPDGPASPARRNAAVLGIFAEQDARVDARRDTLDGGAP